MNRRLRRVVMTMADATAFQQVDDRGFYVVERRDGAHGCWIRCDPADVREVTA